MFAKRVKFIRDMLQEKAILEKKIQREVSKFSDNLETEIKKKFRRINPGIQIKIERIDPQHFEDSKKRKNPLLVVIEEFNGRAIHTNGVWVFPHENKNQWYETVNDISVKDFEDILRQLSEDLDVLIDFGYVEGIIVDFK